MAVHIHLRIRTKSFKFSEEPDIFLGAFCFNPICNFHKKPVPAEQQDETGTESPKGPFLYPLTEKLTHGKCKTL